MIFAVKTGSNFAIICLRDNINHICGGSVTILITFVEAAWPSGRVV